MPSCYTKSMDLTLEARENNELVFNTKAQVSGKCGDSEATKGYTMVKDNKIHYGGENSNFFAFN